MSGALRIAIVLVVAAAATIAANVVLLGVAGGSHDPVGRLSPRAALVTPGSAAATPTVQPPPPALPAHGHEGERADD